MAVTIGPCTGLRLETEVVSLASLPQPLIPTPPLAGLDTILSPDALAQAQQAPDLNYLRESEWATISVNEPSVLHVRSEEASCHEVEVKRVARCLSLCNMREVEYCFPQTCPITFLPVGLYKIRVARQPIPGLPVGTQVDVYAMLEPVGQDFQTFISSVQSGTKGCCC